MAIKIAGTEVINDNRELVLAKLTEINTSIADTAVDVFVYDTRKDSDGGAWRKRTQHTSWYNETLNTSTRGSRKEFPAVAVIVAESNQVTIYDGDDPDLPMWMVFNMGSGVSYHIGYDNRPLSSITALDGTLLAGLGHVNGYLNEIHFAEDASYSWTTSGKSRYTTDIANRNSTATDRITLSTAGITNRYINDVAMTVLPNAPIDAATGLPVPTIAVATSSGTSVIRDDGTVVDISADGTIGGVDKVAFYGTNKLWTGCNTVGSGTRNSYSYFIPTSDTTAASTTFRIGRYVDPSTSGGDLFYSNVASNIQNSIAYGENNIAADADDMGLSRISENEAAPSTGMTNFTTSSYNTGWMNGDIKLATLSDTDDTNVTGSELVTNGTFDTDTSGWTLVRDGIGTAVQNSGTLIMTSDGNKTYMSQQISVESGKKYILTFDVVAASGLGSFDTIMGFGSSSGSVSSYTRAYTAGSYHHYYTADSSSVYVTVGLPSSSESGDSITLDNISVTEVEEDRSVNGNGLQVFGTVTKSAVATGADLVAYSGFSSSNYLRQPYNSDLDFGTGDFCYIWWADIPTTAFQTHFTREHHNGSSFVGASIEVFSDNATNKLKIFMSDDGYATYDAWDSSSTISGMQCFAVVRQGNVIHTYIDGSLDNTHTISAPTGSMDNSDATLSVGVQRNNASANTTGSIALLRASATAPSPEQIKKIYEDEKVLFQEGAQATLYGSSDAVTALAYDDSTDLLHVGTSAGRSVFQGLRRVDNTTTAVGAAISASNGLVADE